MNKNQRDKRKREIPLWSHTHPCTVNRIHLHFQCSSIPYSLIFKALLLFSELIKILSLKNPLIISSVLIFISLWIHCTTDSCSQNSWWVLEAKYHAPNWINWRSDSFLSSCTLMMIIGCPIFQGAKECLRKNTRTKMHVKSQKECLR